MSSGKRSEPLYVVGAVSTGRGRDGRVRTSDNRLDLEMRAPRELGGSGDGFNPEQLFAAGYAACFHSALQAQARTRRLSLADSVVNSEVSLSKADSNVYVLSIVIDIAITGIARTLAEEVVVAAEKTCPYSNATRGNVEIEIRLNGAALVLH